MTLWSDLARATGEGGEFEGWPSTQMILMLQHLRVQSNMRFSDDGQTSVSQTLRGLHERSFRKHFHLSGEQYSCITRVFDSCDVGEITAAYGASIPPPENGLPSGFRRRCFSSDKKTCCGKVLRVRYKSCTVYERDDVYAAWMVVRSCRTCGARYMFDRRILRGQVEGSSCAIHLFSAWGDGEIPEHIASKAGTTVCSSRLLGDAGVSLATTRCVDPSYLLSRRSTVIMPP